MVDVHCMYIVLMEVNPLELDFKKKNVVPSWVHIIITNDVS